jgi:hypothetical protein
VLFASTLSSSSLIALLFGVLGVRCVAKWQGGRGTILEKWRRGEYLY